jgi:pilus assembly protein CpaD
MKNLYKPFQRSMFLAGLCVATSVLSGCVADDVIGGANSDRPETYAGSDNYPITVAKGPVTLEVSSKHASLEAGQINAVIGFAHQARSAGLTPITISRPSGGGASARVASEVAALISQQGIPRKAIRITTYPAPASAPVNVSYLSTYAKTEKCGDWSEDVTNTLSNAHMNSHGCAVQANIAAMVDDPNTLIVPEPTTAIPAVTRMKPIELLNTPAAATTTSSTGTP